MDEKKQCRLAFIFCGIAITAATIGEFLRYCIRHSDAPRQLTQQASQAATAIAWGCAGLVAVVFVRLLRRRS
jgi:hypothetical protein